MESGTMEGRVAYGEKLCERDIDTEENTAYS